MGCGSAVPTKQPPKSTADKPDSKASAEILSDSELARKKNKLKLKQKIQALVNYLDPQHKGAIHRDAFNEICRKAGELRQVEAFNQIDYNRLAVNAAKCCEEHFPEGKDEVDEEDFKILMAEFLDLDVLLLAAVPKVLEAINAQ
eukprot:gnl/Spiro4/15340_TR8247_c0_g1_i1.p1 gnl/Spiro4/15340_TR8247_c0_g1~~gnl/Spiro4/15340_TR8247_c0_g1_i1.p1  ORF type:complete len:158 (-),score=52.53 gnl/Spiro4/15340_TR8247_c0_g1_i1:40-471(-)